MAEYGKVFDSLKANVDYINTLLPIKESFDLIQRDIIIGERQCTFFFIDGFTKDETMQKLMSAFFAIKKDYINNPYINMIDKSITGGNLS